VGGFSCFFPRTIFPPVSVSPSKFGLSGRICCLFRFLFAFFSLGPDVGGGPSGARRCLRAFGVPTPLAVATGPSWRTSRLLGLLMVRALPLMTVLFEGVCPFAWGAPWSFCLPKTGLQFRFPPPKTPKKKGPPLGNRPTNFNFYLLKKTLPKNHLGCSRFLTPLTAGFSGKALVL